MLNTATDIPTQPMEDMNAVLTYGRPESKPCPCSSKEEIPQPATQTRIHVSALMDDSVHNVSLTSSSVIDFLTSLGYKITSFELSRW